MPDEPTGCQPGIYPFTEMVGDAPTRFHLRVDPDGSGMLLANSAEAAHLSPVGTLMVHEVLSGADDVQILEAVRAGFRGASARQVTDDITRVRALISDLTTPDHEHPVTNFGGWAPVDERQLGAPFQAHVAQGAPEQIEPILRSLWDVGVPQVAFLADPSRDQSEIVRLVEIAEDIGMIAGIRTVAKWLSTETLNDAANAGLDFLTLVYTSCDPDEHDSQLGAGDHAAALAAFEFCRDVELCPMAQVPLTDHSADELERIVECLCNLGVRNMRFYAIACLDGEEEHDAAGALPARALPQVATEITEAAEDFGATFLWDPPVRMDLAKSLADHVIAGPRASGEVSIRIEADGSVYAPRGPAVPCGNIVEQPWDEIWAHEAFTRYRESVESPRRCEICPDIEICAAGCVKDPSGWADDTDTGGAS